MEVWGCSCDFDVELGSDVCVCVTVQQEVLLCLHLSVWIEPTQPVLSGQPGLLVSTQLYGQAVVTESLHS